MAILESIVVGTAVNAGTSLLSSLFSKGKKAPKKATAVDFARQKEAQVEASYSTKGFETPGAPARGSASFAKSEDLYAGYRLPAVVDALIERIDSEKGSDVGKFGVISDSDISVPRA